MIVGEITEVKKDYICLKWGTLKEWQFHNGSCSKLMEEYLKDGVSMGCMTQNDTSRQKEIICEVIDACTADKILLDWDNKYVSKEEAKKYVTEYGKEHTNDT